MVFYFMKIVKYLLIEYVDVDSGMTHDISNVTWYSYAIDNV